MKTKLISIILSLSLCVIASAQEVHVKTDSTNQQILNELRVISSRQKESQEQRQHAVEERQRRDSLNNKKSSEGLLTEYGIMAQIEDNTHQDPIKDGWNFYGILAISIAVISACISWYTYKAQQKTVGNTNKLSRDAQRKLLNDLLRHLYRNYVITYTMRTKMKDIGYSGYPSEEHFEKLKVPMENIHLDAFYGDDDKFELMHVLYLNLRNYNEEISVALKHIIDPSVKQETKDEDFDTLEFKVSYLTEKIIDTIKKIWGNNPEYEKDMKKALNLSLSGETNATNNIDVTDSEKFEPLSIEDLKKTSYSKLYNDKELVSICQTFNNDVHEERKKNARGAWKVRIIRY